MSIEELAEVLKLSDLAQKADFKLGLLAISPSRRSIEGPAGTVHVEPLIMQVFLLLAEAHGKVVTRSELFDAIWGGVIVGDDSLNRAVAKVRRIGAQVAPGVFEIETVPRTGYVMRLADALEEPAAAVASVVDRRSVVAGGVLLAGAAALGWWTVATRQGSNRYEKLIASGRQALRFQRPSDATPFFKQAVAIRPDEPQGLGLLAYVLASSLPGKPSETEVTIAAAEEAMRAALAADPKQPHALLARFIFERSPRDWTAAEDQLREIIRVDPRNVDAMEWLVALLQAAGRNRDSLRLNEHLIGIDPVAPGPQFRRALKYWIFGRSVEADRVIDRLIHLWPSHPWVWNARFLIFAFTGRAPAALAMLDGEAARAFVTPQRMAQWRPTLAALDHPTPMSIASAREANLQAATQSPGQAAYAVMALSGLGELDAAYEVANGFLFSRGKIVTQRPADASNRLVNATSWQQTQWISTPPMADFRADGRFGRLCDEIGLTAYWRTRRIRPDYPNVRLPGRG